MQLNCSELFSEAVFEENDTKRLQLLTRICKQISQILPFQKLWPHLMKQDNLCKYMLLCQNMFGENVGLIFFTSQQIHMLLHIMIEKLCIYPEFCIEFTSACNEIFSSNQPNYCLSIHDNFQYIHLACLTKIKVLVNYILKQPDQIQYKRAALHTINLYKLIMNEEQNQEVIIQACKDVIEISKKWKLIKLLSPGIINEIEDILIEKQYQNANINVDLHYSRQNSKRLSISTLQSDDFTSEINHESPQKITLKKSLRDRFITIVKSQMQKQKTLKFINENRMVHLVEQWLFKGIKSDRSSPDEVPIIYKGVSSQFSQEYFKLSGNIELILSFIFHPLKYSPSKIWQGLQEVFENNTATKPKSGQGRRKLTMFDMPNLKEVTSKLPQPKVYYHIRAIRTLQCLVTEQNHILILKVNEKYLQIAFTYMFDCLSQPNSSYANYNLICVLLQFFLQREFEITFYYFLYYNLPHKFILNLHYDLVWQFLLQLLCQMKASLNQPYRLRLFDQCWQYFDSSNFFFDLVNYILHQKNVNEIEKKCTSVFRNSGMVQILQNQPDFLPDSRVTTSKLLNFTTEEELSLSIDIDKIKPMIQRKFVKALRFFNKYVDQPKKNDKKSDLSIIEILRKAIKEALTMKFDDDEGNTKMPISKKKFHYFHKDHKETKEFSPSKRFSQTSLKQFNSNKKLVKLPSLLPSPKDSTTGDTRGFNNSIHEKQTVLSQGKQSSIVSRLSLLYPKSLKDISSNRLDYEEKLESYNIENLLKNEQLSFNGVQLCYEIVNQLILLLENKDLYQKFGFDTLNLQFYLQILLQNKQSDIFDQLMKIYLYKIKLSSFKKDNSGVLCGKIINTLLKNIGQLKYIQLDSNLETYFDYLAKVINQSFEWGQVPESIRIQNLIIPESIDCGRLELLTTFRLLLEYAYNGLEIKNQLLNRVSSQTWSTLLTLQTEHCANNALQQLMISIFKITIENGNSNIYHQIFLKLNAFNYIRKVIDLTQQNRVLDSSIKLDSYLFVIKGFLKQFNLYLNVQKSKNHLKQAKANIEILVNWNYIKNILGITNSIVSPQSRSDNSVPPSPKRRSSQLIPLSLEAKQLKK